jgi:hypothetical protein
MYVYTINTETGESRSFSHSNEILTDLEKLRSDDFFVVIESSPPVGNVNFIQASNIPSKKGLFKKEMVSNYAIEIQITDEDGSLRQYSYDTRDFEEINSMLINYISFQQVPDFSLWCDITQVIGLG